MPAQGGGQVGNNVNKPGDRRAMQKNDGKGALHSAVQAISASKKGPKPIKDGRKLLFNS